jgi:hypothetical protein
MQTQMDLVQIILNGGGLRIRSSRKSAQDLVQLAMNAKGRAHLTIVVDSYLSQTELVQIAANGDGAVVFDFTGS